VQLGDDFLKEMYMNFMLIYMGEHTAEVLSRCGIAEVTDRVQGFCEMALNRMGSLLDQPRAVRVQNLQAERARRKARAEQQLRDAAANAKNAERTARLTRANQRALAQVAPLAAAWARGDGDEAALKRYGRRTELQLLMMEPLEMKRRVSALQHGQSGRLGEAMAGLHGLISLHPKAWGCPPHS